MYITLETATYGLCIVSPSKDANPQIYTCTITSAYMVCMYVCTYVRMYVCMHVSIDIHTYIHPCMHAYIHACMHACMYKYNDIYIFISYLYIYIYIGGRFRRQTSDSMGRWKSRDGKSQRRERVSRKKIREEKEPEERRRRCATR